jgi:hypothetical protein
MGVYDFLAFMRFVSSEKLSPEAVLGLGWLAAILILTKLLMLLGGETATSSSRLIRSPAMAKRDDGEGKEWRGEVLLLLWCFDAGKREVVLTTATLSLIMGEGRSDVSMSTRIIKYCLTWNCDQFLCPG